MLDISKVFKPQIHKHATNQLLSLLQVVFKRIKLNFLWAFFYNLIALPLACGVFYPAGGVYIPPAIAGLSEIVSSIPVILFSLLLYQYRKPLWPWFVQSFRTSKYTFVE